MYTVTYNNNIYRGDVNFMVNMLMTEDNVLFATGVFTTVIDQGITSDIAKLLHAPRFSCCGTDRLSRLFDEFKASESNLTVAQKRDILVKFREANFQTKEFLDVCDDFVAQNNCLVYIGDLVNPLQIAYDNPYEKLMDALKIFYETGERSTGLTFQKVYDEAVNKYSQLISKENV